MRNIIKFSPLLVFMSFFIIYSCSKQKSNDNTLTINEYNRYGAIHNDFLTNVRNNFEPDDDIISEDEKIEYIYQFNLNFAQQQPLSNSEKELLVNSFNKYKHFIKTQNVAKLFTNESAQFRSTNDSLNMNVFDLINELYNLGVIRTESYQILYNLATDIKDNYDGLITNDELKNRINSYIQDFNNAGYEEGGEGEMIGTVLAISLHSLEWWEQNPDATSYSGRGVSNFAVPAWVVADAAGALFGAAWNLLGQSGGDIDWESVAWSALGGAIFSSSGIVRNIYRWIK